MFSLGGLPKSAPQSVDTFVVKEVKEACSYWICLKDEKSMLQPLRTPLLTLSSVIL